MGQLILETNIHKGSLIESVSGNLITPNANVNFSKTNKGWSIVNKSGGKIDMDKIIPNDTYTAVFWVSASKLNSYIMDLRTSSGTGFVYISHVSKVIATSNGTIYINNVQTSNINFNRIYCIVVSGITLNASKIVLLQSYTGGGVDGINIIKTKIYKGILTSKEREREQIEFEAAQPLTYQKRLLQLPKPTELKQSGLIAAYNMKPVGNILHDISGNGNNGTTNGCLKLINGVRFNGISDRVSKSAISDISTTKKFTICIRIKPNNIINGQQIVVNGNSGTDRCGIVIVSNTIGIETYNGTYKSANGAITNKTVNSFVAICNENTLSAYLNGVLLSGTSTTGNLVNTLGGFAIGSSVLNSNYFNGEIYDIRIYNRVLSTQEIKAYHNSFNEITLQESFDDMAVGSSKLPNGWIKSGGSFVCGENTTNDAVIKSIRKRGKYLKCNTAGIVAIPCKQAYGTWEFDLFKAVGNIIDIYIIDNNLITSDIGSYRLALSTNNAVQFIKTATNILSATINSYISNSVWSRIRITRTTSGVFSIYILGGNFTNWTLVSTIGGSGTNPVTDNTYTISNYFVISLNANDRVGNILLSNQIRV